MESRKYWKECINAYLCTVLSYRSMRPLDSCFKNKGGDVDLEFNGYKVSFGDDEKVLERDSGDGYITR